MRDHRTDTYRRVVQNRPDIPILNLVERIDTPNSVVEKLVEDETDTSSTRQLVEREVVGVSIDHRSEFRAELCDGRKDDASLIAVAHCGQLEFDQDRIWIDLNLPGWSRP